MGRFVGDMNWRTFTIGYVSFLVVGVTLALWGERRFHVRGERIILAEGAIMFTVAAIGRPHVVYRVVRNTGWFAAIQSDVVMRWILGVLAVFLAAGAWFMG
jgi:hypothetical protein